jgi:hypothetical protein
VGKTVILGPAGSFKVLKTLSHLLWRTAVEKSRDREDEKENHSGKNQEGGSPSRGLDDGFGHGCEGHGSHSDSRQDQAARQTAFSYEPLGDERHVGRIGQGVDPARDDHPEEEIEMADATDPAGCNKTQSQKDRPQGEELPGTVTVDEGTRHGCEKGVGNHGYGESSRCRPSAPAVLLHEGDKKDTLGIANAQGHEQGQEGYGDDDPPIVESKTDHNDLATDSLESRDSAIRSRPSATSSLALPDSLRSRALNEGEYRGKESISTMAGDACQPIMPGGEVENPKCQNPNAK